MKPIVGTDGRYHIVYRTHNLINGKEYTGKHSTKDINDGYYGSGPILITAINKYGLENFAVEILSFHESEEAALAEEARIVDEEYVNREDTYNYTLGGEGSWFHTKGKVVVKNKDGNAMQVSVDDQRYLSGELVPISYGMVNAIDEFGNKIFISKNEYYSGKYTCNNTGKTPVIDKDGNSFLIDKSKYDRTIHRHPVSGLVSVKDKDGNTMQVSVNDPRYLSGELISINSNTVIVKDKNGNKFQTTLDDPRYLSGELVGHTKGHIMAKDKDGNTFHISLKDPRFLSGELVGINKGKNIDPGPIIICPHCNKTGYAKGLKQHHFDHCKENPNRIPPKKHKKYEQNFKLFKCPHCGKEGKGGGMVRFHFDNCKNKSI